jgi:undecaprenyl-diphosphatase
MPDPERRHTPWHAQPDPDDNTDRIGDRDLTAWPTRAGQAVVRTTMRAVDGSRGWLDERSTPLAVLLVTALIGMLVAGVFTVVSAQIYEAVAERNGVAAFDRPVLVWVAERRTDSMNTVVAAYTNLGGTVVMPVIATVLALTLALWWRRWTPVLLMAVAAGGSVALTIVGKQAIGRARPPHVLAVAPFESSPSFPSGHTLNSWVILLLAAYLVCCKAKSLRTRVVAVVAALVLAIAMGLSRVYLGAHWLTDVLVAWTLGSAWLIVVITAHRLALTVVRRPGRPAGPAAPP